MRTWTWVFSSRPRSAFRILGGELRFAGLGYGDRNIPPDANVRGWKAPMNAQPIITSRATEPVAIRWQRGDGEGPYPDLLKAKDWIWP